MARVLSTAVVLALLAATAVAFALTEGAKLDKSPIAATQVDPIFSPDGTLHPTADLDFKLRKTERIEVWIEDKAGHRLRMLLGPRTFRHGSKVSWWMFIITRNRCINAVKAPSLVRDDETELDALPAAGSDPAMRLEETEDEERVRQLMLEHLDEQERLALWLGCFERMPVEGITKALKLTNSTGARGLLQRARRKLRAALETRARTRIEANHASARVGRGVSRGGLRSETSSGESAAAGAAQAR